MMDHFAQQTKLGFAARQRWVLAAVSVLLFAGLCAWVVLDVAPPWRTTQAEFHTYVSETLGEERASLAPSGIQQVYLEDLDRIAVA